MGVKQIGRCANCKQTTVALPQDKDYQHFACSNCGFSEVGRESAEMTPTEMKEVVSFILPPDWKCLKTSSPSSPIVFTDRYGNKADFDFYGTILDCFLSLKYKEKPTQGWVSWLPFKSCYDLRDPTSLDQAKHDLHKLIYAVLHNPADVKKIREEMRRG